MGDSNTRPRPVGKSSIKSCRTRVTRRYTEHYLCGAAECNTANTSGLQPVGSGSKSTRTLSVSSIPIDPHFAKVLLPNVPFGVVVIEFILLKASGGNRVYHDCPLRAALKLFPWHSYSQDWGCRKKGS